MSKKSKTANLDLITYINAIGIPTFLNEWTDNAEKIDTFAGAISSAVSALDERLSSAESTLEDLSPDSIEDYKIRLDALEKKVNINVTNIKNFNTRVDTVDAEIRAIQAEQSVQNNRLTAIEDINEQQTTQIASLTTNLASANQTIINHEGRIATLEQEINDLQSDVNGFNEDITILTGQIETLSDAVEDLTNLVNSLQLDVIGEKLQALSNLVNSFDARITTNAENIATQGETLTDHDTRITENSGNIDDIQNEIGDTDYSEIGADISSSLVALDDKINALSPEGFDELEDRVSYIENDIANLGALARKDNASGEYTPSGTVTTEISGTQTAGIQEISNLGRLPSLAYDSANESITFNAGALPSFGDTVNVVTSIGSASSSFTGTNTTITVS